MVPGNRDSSTKFAIPSFFVWWEKSLLKKRTVYDRKRLLFPSFIEAKYTVGVHRMRYQKELPLASPVIGVPATMIRMSHRRHSQSDRHSRYKLQVEYSTTYGAQN